MATTEAAKSEGNSTPYDELPYPSYPFPQTHPARLATVATLFGMTPEHVERCRVLEIGCASGGNLIPMADLLPESRFLGIDLSERQIKEGQTTIAAVGLKNIELRALNILDVTSDLGEFDYIICHGVYSWVPPAVQDKILVICKSHLAPQGVAYVSYNTLLGWNMRRTIRDLMCFHAAKVTDPRRRVGEARRFLDFMAAHVPTEDNPYGALIKSEVERMRKQSDAYLLHEHLEETNAPCYFHEFVRAASQHDLQYLGESDIHVMAVGNLGPEVASVIRQIAVDAMETEQYMDFFRNRAFRQTLLCHSNVSLSRSVRAESVLDAFISTRLAPKSPEKIVNLSDPMEFVTQDGWPITSNAPLLTAALIALHEARPHRIGFQDLFELGASRLTSDCVQNFERQEYDRRRLGGELLRIYILGLIDIAHWAPNGLRGTQSYPKASTLVRHRARVSSTLTNMYHENLQVQDLERQILGHSDGKTSLEDVIRLLAEECLAGKLVIREGGKLVTEIGEAMKALSNLVPSSLDRLRRQGFLPGAAGLFCRLMFCLTLSSTKKAPGTD